MNADRYPRRNGLEFYPPLNECECGATIETDGATACAACRARWSVGDGADPHEQLGETSLPRALHRSKTPPPVWRGGVSGRPKGTR